MKQEALQQFVNEAPSGPGVYIFKNARGKTLYVGKAVNIKNRLKNYLKTADVRIRKMVETASRVAFTETPTEIEALILEARLIKAGRPQFNIVMRDDKNYFFVGFTKEDFPRIILTHQPAKKSDGGFPADYIGPFTDGAALKATLRYLRRVFPYCSCKQKHNNYCLNYHIGKCPGYCCLKKYAAGQAPADKKEKIREYRANISAIREILEGKKDSFLKKLEKEMISLGKKKELEKAIELQSRIEKIKTVFENARIISEDGGNEPKITALKKALGLAALPRRIEGYDISNISGVQAVGAMVVFTNGRADKNEYKKFKIQTIAGADDTGMLTEILERRLKHEEWAKPDLILVDGGIGQFNAVSKVLARASWNVPVVALTKDDRHQGVKIIVSGRSDTIYIESLPREARDLVLAVDSEAHRFAISYYRALHRRTLR